MQCTYHWLLLFFLILTKKTRYTLLQILSHFKKIFKKMEKHLKNWFLLILLLQNPTASVGHDDHYCQLKLCFKARAFELIQTWLLKWSIKWLSKLKDKNVSKSANRFGFGYSFNMLNVTWFGFTQWSVNGLKITSIFQSEVGNNRSTCTCFLSFNIFH